MKQGRRIGGRAPQRLGARASLATLLLVVLAAVAAPAAVAKPEPRFFGVAPQSVLTEKDFSLMQKDGVGSIRQLFFWPSIEQSPGQYSWGQTDTLMRWAAASRIEIFPVLYGTPSWAQTETLNRKCSVTCGPQSAEAREAFGRFAGAVVERYGPNGDFWTETPDVEPPPPPDPPPPPPDPCPIVILCKLGVDRQAETLQRAPAPCGCTAPLPVREWQIWNEQNSPKYFGPKPNASGYAELLRAAAGAIRAVDPSADVVLGGMWGPPEISPKVLTHTQRYLKQLYRLEGINSSFDSIALHPYAARFSAVSEQINDVRRLMDRSGDAGKGIWVTELGWASGGPRREGLVKTPKQQAGLVRKSYKLLIRKQARWNIRGVYWYSWRDTGKSAGICAWCPKSGLRTKSGKAKPAAKAFRKLAR